MARVLLIEDDALIRTLMMRRLTGAGWNVIALRDGRDMDAILASEKVDLLVIDLGLPYIDGFALIEHLRARGINTPVLALTGHDLPHMRDTVIGAGANELIQKPFDQDELLRRMNALLAA
jgi:two-component system OmpR family response regulator